MRLFRTLLLPLSLVLALGADPPDGPKPDRPGEMRRRGGGQGRGPNAPRAGARQARGPKANGKGGAGAQGGQGAGRKGMLGLRGNAFLRQGSNRAAVASFERQLALNPDSAALHVGLGKALGRMGRCEEALEHLWPYVGMLAFGSEAALTASTCSSRMGLLDDAIYFDRMAVDLDPTSARALTNLALDLESAGDAGGVEEALDELLFLRQDRDASQYARAVLALRAGDLDTFDRVTFAWEQADGPSLDLRRLQAQAWLDTDQPLAALDALENVRRIRNGQQVRHLRAEAYRRIGYPGDAANYLEDRPQAVLEGVDSDAVKIRVFADLGDFAKAHEVLDGYEGLHGADLAASAWYLAKKEGRADELPGLALAYERARTSPLRDLEQLVPWTER